MALPRTLFDKIWDHHLVNVQEDGTCLLYIDRHLVHEVTSPQAFEGLKERRPAKCAGPTPPSPLPDHNVSTKRPRWVRIAERGKPHPGRNAAEANCKEFGVPMFKTSTTSARAWCTSSGPEQGLTQPGMTIVCGDSAHQRPTAPSARWPSASAPRKSSTCWPPSVWCCRKPA